MKHAGKVYLVGAGPGDAGLMTLRGAELLARADVVVHDALINRDILAMARSSAEIIYGGKRYGEHAIPQEEINQLLVAKARAGQCVVRLKGGDPDVFGRGGEEALALAAANIPFEVVPGVSSIWAVPNYAGIPITHRDYCSSFTVYTGHEEPDKDGVDWALAAKTPGTKIILMGVTRIRQISQVLTANGMDENTPVAMIRWGTTGRQRSIEGTLKTIADIAERAAFKPPGLTIIGEVVKLRHRLNWFEELPLFGRRIVVTRAGTQAGQLSRLLLEHGADVLEIPVIRIEPPTEHRALADALLELNAYDWLIFTSANGVAKFFEYFFKAFDDMRDIGGVRIAAVGPGTAAKLQELHLKVDLMPAEATGAALGEALTGYESIENLKLLLLRAEVAGKELPQKLEELGAIVDDVACYKTVPETEDRNGAGARLLKDGADWITFASGSAVENFHARFNLNQLLTAHPQVKFASIGPETSKALATLGFQPALEAKEHTIAGLVKALEKAVVAAELGRTK
jgi:uroporphyrinogen III methyltransferase/synthase